jgi:hypothetical protein
MRPVSVGTTLTTATKTTVFTVPVGYYAKWTLAYAVNHSGNNKPVDIVWYDSSAATEYHVIDAYVLTPTQFIKFDNAYIVLEEGDEVRVQTEAATVMGILNTFELERNKG